MKEIINKMKSRHMEWKKIIAGHVCSKGLVHKKYIRNSYNLIKTSNFIFKIGKNWIDISPKKDMQNIHQVYESVFNIINYY